MLRNVKNFLTAFPVWVKSGAFRGVLILAFLGTLVAWPTLGWFYNWLNVTALESLSKIGAEFPDDTKVVWAADAPRSKNVLNFVPMAEVYRNVAGEPLLCRQPLPGEHVLQNNQAVLVPAHRKLLSRYTARLRTVEPKENGPATNSSTHSSGAASGYDGEVALVEVVLEWTDENEWRVFVDIGFRANKEQTGGGVWRRIPWWEKEGIAPTNELIVVTRGSFPTTWSIATPTTAEAVCAYMKDYFPDTAKSLNNDYWQAPGLNVKPKEFERAVTHPFMRILPADFGGVSVRPRIFVFNTLNGPLQALMLGCFIAILMLLAFRYAALLNLRFRRWIRNTQWIGPRDWICSWIGRGGDQPDELAAWAKMMFEKDKLGYYLLRQLEAWIVYFGLLGTLVYLSLAIMQLRIHPSAAVMQSILARMGVTMAQAFLTTIVSSTLQRIAESLREFVAASEERAVLSPHSVESQANSILSKPAPVRRPFSKRY